MKCKIARTFAVRILAGNFLKKLPHPCPRSHEELLERTRMIDWFYEYLKLVTRSWNTYTIQSLFKHTYIHTSCCCPSLLSTLALISCLSLRNIFGKYKVAFDYINFTHGKLLFLCLIPYFASNVILFLVSPGEGDYKFIFPFQCLYNT